MRSIFGVDPGLHCGLLHYRLDTGAVEMMELGPLDAADWLASHVTSGDFVAVERYTPRGSTGRMTRQNDALEVIGMCRHVAHRVGAVFLLQGVSDAQKTGTSDVLKALGWWRKGDPDHIRRAAAQAALAYAQSHPDDFERRTGPGTVI